ncbi:MAG TPA: FAD-dependent oxidoreductase, partial [Burkholderiales bacterium]|nr:FAD-dependent oxidoreductase [Burkholderiales bacterium]
MKVYDALVIGGGPAGATATLLLAREGWSVAVVERERFPRHKVCGEFISAATWQLLRELGLADALASRAGPAVREVGIYAGKRIITAPMPPYLNGAEPYGRA